MGGFNITHAIARLVPALSGILVSYGVGPEVAGALAVLAGAGAAFLVDQIIERAK